MHDEFLPALQSTQGVAWVGHYDIVEHPDRPYIEGAPIKKETRHPLKSPTIESSTDSHGNHSSEYEAH